MLKKINQKYNRLIIGTLALFSLLPLITLADSYSWLTQESQIAVTSDDQLASVSFTNTSLVGVSELNSINLEVDTKKFQPLSSVQHFNSTVASTTDFMLNIYFKSTEVGENRFTNALLYKTIPTEDWKILPETNSVNNRITGHFTGSSDFYFVAVSFKPQYLIGKKINYFGLALDGKNVLEADISSLAEKIELPNQIQLSDIYQIDFKNENFNTATLNLPQIRLANYRSNLYYLSANEKIWRVLKSGVDQKNQFIKAQVPVKNFKLVLVADKKIQSGTATWYKYKNCNCAASRDWPKNTRLKITNIEFGSKYYGRSVVVRVNDYGPEIQTGHVIDLDVLAFRKISPKSSGITPVLIQKVE